MVPTSIAAWAVFNLFVIAMLALDLGVFHRKSHTVKVREAVTWTIVWVAMALVFNAWLYHARGSEVALQFLTGYLIEKALSVDNIFVFLLIFSYFRVPAQYQHKILFWGVVGALVMRVTLILAGVALIHRFHWVLYLFGAFLVFTGIRMALHKGEEVNPEANPVLKLARRLLPVTQEHHGDRFFVRQAGRRAATPLFIVLLLVETTDLVFAVDSIPAILAITPDAFIVYTSNVFAILGLRSLYFALGEAVRRFHYLHYGLSVILVFIGIKMLVAELYKIPVGVALGVVAAILVVSGVASALWPPALQPDKQAS